MGLNREKVSHIAGCSVSIRLWTNITSQTILLGPCEYSLPLNWAPQKHPLFFPSPWSLAQVVPPERSYVRLLHLHISPVTHRQAREPFWIALICIDVCPPNSHYETQQSLLHSWWLNCMLYCLIPLFLMHWSHPSSRLWAIWGEAQYYTQMFVLMA